MRITLDREAVRTLLTVEGACKRAKTHPNQQMLAIGLTAFDGGGLKVHANLGDRGYTFTLPGASVERAGAVVLEVSSLLAVLKAKPESVLIEVADGLATATTQQGRRALSVLPDVDIPSRPDEKVDDFAHYVSSTLSRLLAQTIKAVALENSRFAIGGVWFKPSGLVATDGRRLHMASIKVDAKSVAGGKGVIVSTAACNMLAKVAAIEAGWTLRTGKTIAVFDSDCLTLWSLIVEGSFPNVEDVIPTQTGWVGINAAALDAAKVAGVERDGVARVAIVPTGVAGYLGFRGVDEHGSESVATTPTTFDRGEPMPGIAVAHRYFGEAVSAALLSGDPVSIGYKACNKPLTIDAPGFCAIVMPINIIVPEGVADPLRPLDSGAVAPIPTAPPIKAPAPVRAALAKAHAKPAPVAAPANPAPAPTVHAPSTGRPPAAKAHTLSAPAAALVAGLARIGKPANKAALLAVGVDRATWSEALSEAYRAGAVRRVKGADVLHALA